MVPILFLFRIQGEFTMLLSLKISLTGEASIAVEDYYDKFQKIVD